MCCKGDWSLGGYANVRFERVHVRCVICSHGLLRSERVSNHSRRSCTRAFKRNSCPPHRSEYCNTLGFPTWSSTQHPCILCDCRRENMQVMDGLMPQSFPHTLRGYAHLDRACSAAEVPITLTDDLKRKIAPRLKFDKRRQRPGAQGRALAQAIPGTPLLAGDRLEPSSTMPDIGAFEDTSTGLEVTFWRPNAESIAHHRNPIFDEVLGITQDRLVVDILHSFHLGPLQSFCTHAMWELFLCDAWAVGEGRTLDEVVQLSCQAIMRELAKWYSERRRTHPWDNMTEIQTVTPSMFGTRNRRKLALKAGETKYFSCTSNGCCAGCMAIGWVGVTSG